MNFNQIEQAIIEQCIEEDGFLVGLHSLGKFDELKYRGLVTNIKNYKEKLGDNELIEGWT